MSKCQALVDYWTIWNTSNDPAVISYASLSVAPTFPGGDYNTVIGKVKYLGGIKWSNLGGTTFASLSNSENHELDNLEPASSKRNVAYDNIKSKDDLNNHSDGISIYSKLRTED